MQDSIAQPSVRQKTPARSAIPIILTAILAAPFSVSAKDELPTKIIDAELTFAPAVPAPIGDRGPAIVRVNLVAGRHVKTIKNRYEYEYWTLNEQSPGPLIRARVGDVLEVHMTNADPTGMPHNLDFHAVTGPGGGANALTVTPEESKTARFKLLHPGIFYYHCAAPPVPKHIANGMYGLILVEPAGGLPKVDKEFYVVQSEFYTTPLPEGGGRLEYSHEDGLDERPRFVVFNGRVGSLVGENVLRADTGDKVRIYFGNAGPNLISSFHIIGEIFDSVYREGDLVSPPAQSVQTTLIPAGGAAAVEFVAEVPGDYTLVDHAIYRIEKGAAGFLTVTGEARPDIFNAIDGEEPCEGCKVHQ